MNTCFQREVLLWLAAAAAAMLAAGCASTRVNWDSRVGHYTFDQAVKEFGLPDKQAKSSDGELVAEWVSRYYSGGSAVVSGGYYGNPGGSGIGTSPETYYESTLYLTFNTNNVLDDWSKK
jgi:hypothetical protein